MLLEPACFLCVALPRRGHFFAAQSAKKRSPLCPQKREFCSRFRRGCLHCRRHSDSRRSSAGDTKGLGQNTPRLAISCAIAPENVDAFLEAKSPKPKKAE